MGDLGWWLIPILLAIALLGLIVAWRPLRAWVGEIHLERAREMFSLQRERLEAKFIEMAAATGKPRGLRWKDCEWADQFLFARDRYTGEITALVEVTVRFEPIEGSDMEDWAEARRLRNATGVFFFSKGQWHTHGRTIFNMNPNEALQHFKEQYEAVPAA
jgi:hypothetical protein